jgi:hypothetical protein
MRLTDQLDKAQRVVVVIALGVVFGTVGSYLVSLGNTVRGGWYAYAPLTQAVYPPRTGLAGWLRLIIWLVLIGYGRRCPSGCCDRLRKNQRTTNDRRHERKPACVQRKHIAVLVGIRGE